MAVLINQILSIQEKHIKFKSFLLAFFEYLFFCGNMGGFLRETGLIGMSIKQHSQGRGRHVDLAAVPRRPPRVGQCEI